MYLQAAAAALSGSNLFIAATNACGSQDFWQCYALFALFNEKYPDFYQGFTNAGIALERYDLMQNQYHVVSEGATWS